MTTPPKTSSRPPKKSFKDLLGPITPQPQPEQATAGSSDDSVRQVNLRLNPTAKKQLDMMAVEMDTTRQALIEEAINDFFRKHGRPPIA